MANTAQTGWGHIPLVQLGMKALTLLLVRPLAPEVIVAQWPLALPRRNRQQGCRLRPPYSLKVQGPEGRSGGSQRLEGVVPGLTGARGPVPGLTEAGRRGPRLTGARGPVPGLTEAGGRSPLAHRGQRASPGAHRSWRARSRGSQGPEGAVPGLMTASPCSCSPGAWCARLSVWSGSCRGRAPGT